MLTGRHSFDESGEFRRAVLPFLRRHGFSEHAVLSVLRGGANNRVFRVAEPQREAVLKHYFKNPNDPRDRFRAEKAFYDLVWNCGVRSLPEPLGWDAEFRVGLFSFVGGRKLAPAEATSDRIEEAARFVIELNRCRNEPAAAQIEPASEACFSINEHLALVEKRVERLKAIEGTDFPDEEARAFVNEQLRPAWKRVQENIFRQTTASSKKNNLPLAENEKCLSPSDFGFHNSLLGEKGSLTFFDFEYAGWDDPAKLVCDFFCQPELPAGLGHWGLFVNQLSAGLGGHHAWPDRARLLLPAYQVKWCCIMLNDFVRTDQLRRDFALEPATLDMRKAQQLEKARQGLARIPFAGES